MIWYPAVIYGSRCHEQYATIPSRGQRAWPLGVSLNSEQSLGCWTARRIARFLHVVVIYDRSVVYVCCGHGRVTSKHLALRWVCSSQIHINVLLPWNNVYYGLIITLLSLFSLNVYTLSMFVYCIMQLTLVMLICSVIYYLLHCAIVYSFIYSFIYSSIYWFIHPFIELPVYALIYYSVTYGGRINSFNRFVSSMFIHVKEPPLHHKRK